MKVIIIALLALLLGGCKPTHPSDGYGWNSNNPVSDSLCKRLEWQFNDYCPLESINHTIEMLKRTTESDSETQKCRLAYWRARYLTRIGQQDSALCLVKNAMQEIDSLPLSQEYLRLRVFLVDHSENIKGDEEYRVYKECMDYSRETGDHASEAMMAVYLGNLFRSIGEYHQSMEHYRLADSLSESLSFKKFVVKNKLNEALVLKAMGNKASSDSILYMLVDNPMILEDLLTHTQILLHLYSSTKNIKYLRDVLSAGMHDSTLQHRQPIAHAHLADYYLFVEPKTDSAVFYSDLSMKEFPYASDIYDRMNILRIRSIVLYTAGMTDSAFSYRLAFERVADSISKNEKVVGVLKQSAMVEAGLAKMQHREEIYKRNTLILLELMALIIIGGGSWFILSRRKTRQKITSMEAEMKIEKAKSKLVASTIALQEKENVLGVLKEELTQLKKGDISHHTATTHMESVLKLHSADQESTDILPELLEVMNPLFTQRLYDRCGELDDSYVRLACYLLMGLDNKKIARLMMVKPESVRQSKWRLGRRLGLKEGENLNDVLKSLNEP